MSYDCKDRRRIWTSPWVHLIFHKTSYPKISQMFEVMGYIAKTVLSLWNLAVVCAALLSMHQSNLKQNDYLNYLSHGFEAWRDLAIWRFIGYWNAPGGPYLKGISDLFPYTSHDDVIKWKHFLRHWPFVRGPGELPAQRPVTRSFDVFFDLRLNKRLSKQPWGWWFETSLRRQYNDELLKWVHDDVIKYTHFPRVTGEFPTQRPVTRNVDVFFDLRLKKRWFETPSRSLWRHCNGVELCNIIYVRNYMTVRHGWCGAVIVFLTQTTPQDEHWIFLPRKWVKAKTRLGEFVKCSDIARGCLSKSTSS